MKVFGPVARLARFADLDDQVDACRRAFASDTLWTVVRGSDLEEGESQGMPVWSRHVGDPILESNITVTIAGSPDRVRARIADYEEAGLTTIALNPLPTDVWFPLNEGHFPDAALTQAPEFSFPDYLRVIETTLGLPS